MSKMKALLDALEMIEYTSYDDDYDRYEKSSRAVEEDTPVDNILKERSSYGSFKDKARWIQAGKDAIRQTPSWKNMTSGEREALDNIMQKMGRILYGKPHMDNWLDIAGYATLIVNND